MNKRKQSMKSIFYVLSLLLLSQCSRSEETLSLYFKNADGSRSPKLQVQVARTPGEQKLGLMYRKAMGEKEGMVFVFEEEVERSFWMKNTYLALDIIFINGEKSVVSIAERAVPLSESPRLSKKPAKYVVEVKAGLAEAWGIRPGSRLVLDSGAL